MPSTDPHLPHVIGRYAIFGEIASGGMASVHLGQMVDDQGDKHTVAIKRLHPHYAKDPEFVSLFLDEARVACRIRHSNVVQTLDVVTMEGGLFLVMEYVNGESLARLIHTANEDGQRIPIRIAVTVVAQMLYGLHAAHETRDETGTPLDIVHRDVSPQNVLVDSAGCTRVIDFGVAKAVCRVLSTRDGVLRGKLQYMAPERIEAAVVDRRADVYGAAVVLWEVLTGRRLFDADDERTVLGQIYQQIVKGQVPPPSSMRPEITSALEEVVLKGLACQPEERYQTARDMAVALERATELATASHVGEWVEHLAAQSLKQKADWVDQMTTVSSLSAVPAFRSGDLPSLRSARRSLSPTPPPPPVQDIAVVSVVNDPAPAEVQRIEPVAKTPDPLADTLTTSKAASTDWWVWVGVAVLVAVAGAIALMLLR